MIYKIVYDIEGKTNDFINLFETLGDFVFFNNVIYLNTTKNKSAILNRAKKFMKKNDGIIVTEISKDNSKNIDNEILSWCSYIWKKEEFEKFEKESQEKLRVLNDSINQAIENLEKQLKRKEIDENCQSS